MGKIISFNEYLEKKIYGLFGARCYESVINGLLEHPPHPVYLADQFLPWDFSLDPIHSEVLEVLNKFAYQLAKIHGSIPFWISLDLFLVQGLSRYLQGLATAFEKMEIDLENERAKSVERMRLWE